MEPPGANIIRITTNFRTGKCICGDKRCKDTKKKFQSLQDARGQMFEMPRIGGKASSAALKRFKLERILHHLDLGKDNVDEYCTKDARDQSSKPEPSPTNATLGKGETKRKRRYKAKRKSRFVAAWHFHPKVIQSMCVGPGLSFYDFLSKEFVKDAGLANTGKDGPSRPGYSKDDMFEGDVAVGIEVITGGVYTPTPSYEAGEALKDYDLAVKRRELTTVTKKCREPPPRGDKTHQNTSNTRAPPGAPTLPPARSRRCPPPTAATANVTEFFTRNDTAVREFGQAAREYAGWKVAPNKKYERAKFLRSKLLAPMAAKKRKAAVNGRSGELKAASYSEARTELAFFNGNNVKEAEPAQMPPDVPPPVIEDASAMDQQPANTFDIAIDGGDVSANPTQPSHAAKKTVALAVRQTRGQNGGNEHRSGRIRMEAQARYNGQGRGDFQCGTKEVYCQGSGCRGTVAFPGYDMQAACSLCSRNYQWPSGSGTPRLVIVDDPTGEADPHQVALQPEVILQQREENWGNAAQDDPFDNDDVEVLAQSGADEQSGDEGAAPGGAIEADSGFEEREGNEQESIEQATDENTDVYDLDESEIGNETPGQMESSINDGARMLIGMKAGENRIDNGDLASKLSRIDIDKEYHPGVVSEIHDDRACSICYDDDETGTINLDEQHFRIIDEAGGQVNEGPRQNGGDDAPEGARQEENTTEVASLLSLAGDTWGTLNTLAQYLVLADIKSLRLASKSMCHLLPAKDATIAVRPFAKGRQYTQFFKSAYASTWFFRRSIQLVGSRFITESHRRCHFFQETNCLNQVQSLKVSKPSSYSVLHLLGDVPSLEELKIYKGPSKYGPSGPKPAFLKHIRHLDLTKCAICPPQTRLLGKTANLKGLKLRRSQPDIEHTDTGFFEALSKMNKLESFKFVPNDLIRPLDVVGQDEDDDDNNDEQEINRQAAAEGEDEDDDNEQDINRQAAAEGLEIVQRDNEMDDYTLLSNRILCAVCSKPSLKSLSMRNVELREGVGIQPLRQLGRLEELCLSSLGSFEGSDLSLLGNVGANTLKKLTLVHCRLLEGELQWLIGLNRLEELSLIMVCLCDEDLQSLAHLAELKSLNIFGRISGEADLSHLRHLQKLKHLSLQIYCPVDSGFASQLDSLESLESLWLRLDCVDNEEDAIPARGTKLVSVNVDDEESTFCSSVGDRSVNAGASVCSHSAEAQDVRVIQNHPLESLASLSNLRALLIYDTVLTDGLIETISSSLGKLNELSLWDCQYLSEASISYLIDMKPLKRLTLHRFDAFTETGLELLAMTALDELESLEFYLCSNLAHADIGKLRSLISLRKVTVCSHFEQCDLPSHITLVKDETERKAVLRAKHLLRKIKNKGMF